MGVIVVTLIIFVIILVARVNVVGFANNGHFLITVYHVSHICAACGARDRAPQYLSTAILTKIKNRVRQNHVNLLARILFIFFCSQH